MTDSLTLESATHTDTVSVGVPTLVTVQAGIFHVGNSPRTPDGSYSFTINETITINGDSQSITLSGTDSVTAPRDRFTIDSGPSTTFTAAGVTFTPQTLTTSWGGVGADLPITFTAEVTLSTITPAAVPEPSSLTLGGLGASFAALIIVVRGRKPSIA